MRSLFVLLALALAVLGQMDESAEMDESGEAEAEWEGGMGEAKCLIK